MGYEGRLNFTARSRFVRSGADGAVSRPRFSSVREKQQAFQNFV
jgi:hypothetical protein